METSKSHSKFKSLKTIFLFIILILLAFLLFVIASHLWRLCGGLELHLVIVLRSLIVYFSAFIIYYLISCLPVTQITTFLQGVIGFLLALIKIVFDFCYHVLLVIGANVLFISSLIGLYFLAGKVFNVVIPEKVCYYTAFFFTLVFMSYARQILFTPLFKFLSIVFDDSSKVPNEFRSFVDKLDFRKIALSLGFVFYFVSTLDNLSGGGIIRWSYWIKVKEIALEGFLTFLAFDTLATVVFPRITLNKKCR